MKTSRQAPKYVDVVFKQPQQRFCKFPDHVFTWRCNDLGFPRCGRFLAQVSLQLTDGIFSPSTTAAKKPQNPSPSHNSYFPAFFIRARWVHRVAPRCLDARPDGLAISSGGPVPRMSVGCANNLNAQGWRAGQTACKTTESAECTLHYAAGDGILHQKQPPPFSKISNYVQALSFKFRVR